VSKTLRIFLALSAFFVLAFGVAACGGDDEEQGVPSNAVATVGGDPITRADYDRWLEINARQSSASTGGEPVIPDPPTYARCIAELRAQAERVRGQRAPSELQLRSQCRSLDTQLSQQTMALLIQSNWIEREAEELDVDVTDAQLDRALAETRRQSFPTERDFQRFLRESGMTREDILFRLRVQELSSKISRKIEDEAADVTDAQVAAYYNRNRDQFAVPERRDLEIILTRTEGEADDAKATIESGTSWAEAAREFSDDELSKGNGGRLVGVARGQQDRALDEAAFNAREGVIVGPVRGQFGWYIVRVQNVTPPKQNTLEQSRDQIADLLRQQAGSEKLTAFAREFQERWTSDTECREGFTIPICGNAPRARTTSTAGGAVVTTEQR
jgi:foldase protein PrsA